MVDDSKDCPGSAAGRSRTDCGIRPPRNRFKAGVTQGVRDGRTVIIKDCSRCHPLIKNFYARVTVHREARAYEQLKGVFGIPVSFGLEGRDCLVIEYIEGRLLGGFRRGELEADVFDRLDGVLAQAHARGVAFGDLHKSNVIITGSRQVFVIDFAHAVFARNPRRPGLLVRLVMELDRHAARRLRARHLGLDRPAPEGLFGLCYRVGRGLKALHKRLKNVLNK